MANKSVERFKRLTQELKREVCSEALTGLVEQAERLAETMRAVAGEKTGKLKQSIRVEAGRKPNQVLVKAGGALTTKPVRNSAKAPTYDYALAQEFGTQQEPAHPFFYPVYRLRKKPARAAIKRRLTKAIKKRSAE